MNSNNDNKEKFTDDNKGKFTENGEIVAFSQDANDESTTEDLIEITGEDIEELEEKLSLADAIKCAFDSDDEASETDIVEIDDNEVEFAEPEKITDCVEDCIDNEENQAQDESSLDTLKSLHIDDEVVADDEASQDADEKLIEEETSENVETDQLDDTDVNAEAADEDSEVMDADEETDEQSDDVQDETAQESDEPVAEDEISEEIATSDEEVADDLEQEASNDIQDSEDTDEFDIIFDEAEVEDESDEVDLFEVANITPSTVEDIAEIEDAADDDFDNLEIVEEAEAEVSEEDEEELPALFAQGMVDASDDDSEEQSEDESEDEVAIENETDDAQPENEIDSNSSMLTVHKHREDSEKTDGEQVDSFVDDEIFGSDDVVVSAKEKRGLSAWAKKKTAGGWVKFAFKCLGVLILVMCVIAVLYVNGKLDLINYKDADDFEQFYNLSDTDYVSSSDEVYENPVHYNSSTTIEGFNESMIDIPKEDVINVLLIGTDVRGGNYEDRGNTDSMILLSINTRDKNIKLTSFMRDMYVTIPGRGKNRINAAYAYGGPQLLFDTLKVNFDVDVDLYARVNFANFRKIIDKVGGVEIELTQAEARYMNRYSKKYNTARVEPGLQTLDGAQALSYARCRKVDSDFGRTERQRKVVVAFVDKIKGSSITELDSLLNTLLPMIQTNMPKMQIVGLMVDALNYLNNEVETLNVPIKNSWQSVKIRNMSVLCPNFELNKTAIVAHIYSTYKLEVDDTVYQSFDVPKGDTTTKRKTTTTISTSASSTETTSTTETTQISTTTKKTYWWERTTTSTTTTTTRSSQTTTTTELPTTTTAAPKPSKTQPTSTPSQNQSDQEAA